MGASRVQRLAPISTWTKATGCANGELESFRSACAGRRLPFPEFAGPGCRVSVSALSRRREAAGTWEGASCLFRVGVGAPTWTCLGSTWAVEDPCRFGSGAQALARCPAGLLQRAGDEAWPLASIA